MTSKKLNLHTLFGTNNVAINGKLDINTLFKQSIEENIDNFLKPEDLLVAIHKKREEVEKIHIALYKKCCNTIKSANDVGVTSIYYYIPNDIPGIAEYDPLKCLFFIKNNLKTKLILTKIVTQTKIFITWTSIESRIKKSDD